MSGSRIRSGRGCPRRRFAPATGVRGRPDCRCADVMVGARARVRHPFRSSHVSRGRRLLVPAICRTRGRWHVVPGGPARAGTHVRGAGVHRPGRGRSCHRAGRRPAVLRRESRHPRSASCSSRAPGTIRIGRCWMRCSSSSAGTLDDNQRGLSRCFSASCTGPSKGGPVTRLEGATAGSRGGVLLC